MSAEKAGLLAAALTHRSKGAGMIIMLLFCGCTVQKDKSLPGSVKFVEFSQSIVSPTKDIALSINQRLQVPVTLKNISEDTWYRSGVYPVNISYVWKRDNAALPIEGLRTHIPKFSIEPGQSARAEVVVLAPPTPGSYSLEITLLQEGVAWFNAYGGEPLKIACVVR